MIFHIIALFKKNTAKNVAVNSGGSYLNAFFTLIFTLLLTRVLTRAEYGIQSVILTFTYLFANIFDFGISACIYSYLPFYKKDRAGLLTFIKSNVSMQIALSLIAVALFFPLASFLNIWIFKTFVPNWYYWVAFLGIPLYVLQNSILNTLYASSRFVMANLLLNGSNIVKTLFITILIFARGNITMGEIIILFALVGPASFILLAVFSKPHFFASIFKASVKRSQIRLRYTATFFGASQLFNIATRIDLFIVSYFLPASSVGLYALAQKIILNLVVFVSSITQVLSPQFSLLKNKIQAVRQIKKSLAFLSLPAVFFLILIFVPDSVYSILFTSKYLQAANIVRLLSVSYIFYSLAHAPVLFLLYTIKKPIYILISNLIFLFIIAAGSIILITDFKLFAPPLAFFAANVVTMIYLIAMYKKEIDRLN